MAQTEFLIVINFAAGLTVFLFACGELAEKQRLLTSPSAWIYTALVMASLPVMGHSLTTGQPHHPTEVFFNVAVAMHLARKMWQGRQKRCAAKAAQAQAEAEPKPKKRKIKMGTLKLSEELKTEVQSETGTANSAADVGNAETAAAAIEVCDKDVAWLQEWLNKNAGCNLTVDGVGGSLTRAAFITAFANKNAPAITEAELLQIARELGDTDTKRIRAVAKVESAGGGWFDSGLPKILFERHKYWRHTTRPRRVNAYSNPNAGGYTMDEDGNGINDSWEKLSFAVCRDPLAALKSISIGKFQVLGEYYRQCGYDHPIEMLWAARNGELAHYQMLRDYILKVAKIKGAFLALSGSAEANRAFAKAYNGVGYATNAYHSKLAQAMV